MMRHAGWQYERQHKVHHKTILPFARIRDKNIYCLCSMFTVYVEENRELQKFRKLRYGLRVFLALARLASQWKWSRRGRKKELGAPPRGSSRARLERPAHQPHREAPDARLPKRRALTFFREAPRQFFPPFFCRCPKL